MFLLNFLVFPHIHLYSELKQSLLLRFCDVSKMNGMQRSTKQKISSKTIFEVSELIFGDLGPSIDVTDFNAWLIFH